MTLKDTNIIVTGASRGLGSECARALSREGARLVLIARGEEALESVRKSCDNPDQHRSIAADLTEAGQIKAAVTKAREFLGRVDVVLHAAGGGLGLREPLISGEDVHKLLALNLIASIEINRLIAPDMMKQKYGRLVHVGSIASTESVASVGYNTVKSALAAYVRSIGRELAESGIVATGVLPGAFYAPGNSWRRLEKNKPDVVEKFIDERLPRGHIGMTEEIIPLIMLLCSDQASMMGGCMVPIDAGEGRSYVQ